MALPVGLWIGKHRVVGLLLLARGRRLLFAYPRCHLIRWKRTAEIVSLTLVTVMTAQKLELLDVFYAFRNHPET